MATQVAAPPVLPLTDPATGLNGDANDMPRNTHGDLNGVNGHINGVNGSSGHTNGVNGHTNGNDSGIDAFTAPEQGFPGLPPFPDDVPMAPLLRISLAKLLSRDSNAVSRFVRACEDLGFFYLDLTGCELGDKLQNQADQLFDVGEELFKLPVEEKKKYDFSGEGSYFGYKGMGTNVIDKAGNMDRNEFYNVSTTRLWAVVFRICADNIVGVERRYVRARQAIACTRCAEFSTATDERFHAICARNCICRAAPAERASEAATRDP